MSMPTGNRTQYVCAVVLIISSIVLAFVEAFRLDDLPAGVLTYIAQAFLLAGSIFGLDYYVKKLSNGYVNGSRHSQ